MTWGELLQQWWVQATSAIAAGLVVAAVLAIFSQHVRNGFWAPIGRAVRWFCGLRVTTKSRIDALHRSAIELRRQEELTKRRFDEVCELLDVRPILTDSTIVRERIERLQQMADQAQAHAKQQIEKNNSLAALHVAQANQHGAEIAKREREAGRAEGHAEAMTEIAAQRAVPPLRPVWRIDQLAIGDAFALSNTQDGVSVNNVSVDASSGEFVFAGSTQTRGAFDGKLEFRGHKTDFGRRLGVDFTVKWQDTYGEWWSQTVRIEREPRRMTVL